MAKFFSRLFSKGSSFHGSQSSLNDSQNPSRTASSVRTSGSLENLASYHVVPKELEKSKLHKASWEGNLPKVKRLAHPGQINMKDQHMRTPLHLAVVRGRTEIVRYLVQENAKLDLLDNEQRTPLIKAVLSGNQNPQVNNRICQILIEGGAGDSINAVDKQGLSALHYAINFGNHDLVKLFLSNENCDPNLQDRDQMTPLHLAIKKNSPPIVQSLLYNQHDQQADPNLTNHYGQTPLHVAASVGYVEIVQLLLGSNLREPCDSTILDSQQLTAYELAKANHQEACAKLIAEYEEKSSKPKLQKHLTTSLKESLSMKAASSILITPAANLQHDRDDTSDESVSMSTTKLSKPSPRRMKRASDQWSVDNDPSVGEFKPATYQVQSLFQANPLQPDQTKKKTSSTLNELFDQNPLQIRSQKTTTTSERTKPAPLFAIGPIIERMDSDNTSTSMSKPVQPSSQAKPMPVLQPVSNTKSWSDDTTTASPVKKQEPKSNSWDTSVSDDDTTVPKAKKPSSNLQKTQPFSLSSINLTSSDTEDDNSVETEIRRVDSQKPSNKLSIETLVNKQINSSYKVIGVTEVHSPVSDESSWTTSPVPFDQPLPTTGVQNLVQSIKTNDSTWDDDSRPLSVDLRKRQSNGVENLVKITETIVQSNPKQISPKVLGKLLVSSMADRTESISSEDSRHETVNEQKISEQWSVPTSNDRQLPTASKRHSSNSQIQIDELKESIKKLERDHEDGQALKQRLKEMENKKNNFEKLYRENDQLLHDIEDKLEEEKSEKQRLESTTRNLNHELKNIRQKLQSIEDEKDLLNQRCLRLKEERDTHDEKLHTMQFHTTSTMATEDIERIKSQHREEMKRLSGENDDLHHRIKQLQANFDSYRQSLDVNVDSVDEKSSFQRELERLKSERDRIEQEKLEYQTKYNSLQEEIRLILLDRAKLEQKLTGELQEHFQAKQRSSTDLNKHRTQIEQLNIKLDDAEGCLTLLRTQNEALSTSKGPELPNQQYSLHQPLSILTSVPRNNHLSSSLDPSRHIVSRSDELNKTFPQEENYLIKDSRQIRAETERVKSELDHLREDFQRLLSNYEPKNKDHQNLQIHSQIDTFRQFYEQEFRQRQFLMSTIKPSTNNPDPSHRRSSFATPSHTNSLQTVTQLPRQASALLTTNTTNDGVMSSVKLFRQHYHV